MDFTMNPSAAITALLRPYRFRGKATLLSHLNPVSGIRHARVFGFTVDLDLKDIIQRGIYNGTYEVEETHWVQTVLHRGMTFVDVGANVGYYTWLAVSRIGKAGRSIACEPSPAAFERLQTIAAANRMMNVRCVNSALGSQDGTLVLHVPPESYGNHNPSVISYCDGMTAVSVPMTTLDALLTHEGIDTVDLLKLDVEGYELSVLQGAADSIRAGRIRMVLCEFYGDMLERAGTSAEALERWFRDNGFILLREFQSPWPAITNRVYLHQP